jgi:hypothetical protein
VETSAKNRTWVQHVRLAFRKRWVQVCLILLAWLLVGLLTVTWMAPKTIAKGDTSQYKYLHCDQCGMEIPYNKELDQKHCAKCPPEKGGFYMPTVTSIKSGFGGLSPWRWVYMTLFIETLGMLAGVTYLLYLPVADPAFVYFVLACPYCGQRLRYRAVSLGGLGGCSRCKRMIRFPEEEGAVREEDAPKADEEAARAEADHEEH